MVHDIKNAVRNDIKSAEGTDKEGLLCMEQETSDAVFLYDDMDGMNRSYSITDPDSINAAWIADRMIVTDSAQDACQIDTEILAEWLAQHTDKNLFLTLESIVLPMTAMQIMIFCVKITGKNLRMHCRKTCCRMGMHSASCGTTNRRFL